MQDRRQDSQRTAPARTRRRPAIIRSNGPIASNTPPWLPGKSFLLSSHLRQPDLLLPDNAFNQRNRPAFRLSPSRFDQVGIWRSSAGCPDAPRRARADQISYNNNVISISYFVYFRKYMNYRICQRGKVSINFSASALALCDGHAGAWNRAEIKGPRRWKRGYPGKRLPRRNLNRGRLITGRRHICRLSRSRPDRRCLRH